MTEFKIGDVVRLTTGEPDKPGYRVEVRTVTEGISKGSKINLRTLEACEDDYWTVELIERPAPPLPTKPNTLGWATVDGTRHLSRLSADGLWELYDEDGLLGSVAHQSTIEDFEEAVLIPKELADEITEWADDEDGDWAEWYSDTLLQQIADHLKGQDDE